MDVARVLARYDRTMRRDPAPLPPGLRLIRDRMLTAIVGPTPAAHDNCLIYAKSDRAAVEPTIAAAMACFAGHGFEWKLYGHDDPTGALAAGLVGRGFIAGEPETLMALDLAEARIQPASEADVRLLDRPAQLADIVAV